MGKWDKVCVTAEAYGDYTLKAYVADDTLESSRKSLLDRVWLSVDRPLWNNIYTAMTLRYA